MGGMMRFINVAIPNGRFLAGADMVLPEDIKMSDGTVMKKGKRYFTFDELAALQSEHKMPYGAVVPTEDEFYQIVSNVIKYIRCNYGYDGCTAVEVLEQSLGFGMNGWIDAEDMDRYNADPEGFTDVKYVGDCGCYLSDSEGHLGVAILSLAADGNVSVEYGARGCGFSFRPVTY